MTLRPSAGDAAPYYFTYIDQVPDGDIVQTLEGQTAAIRAVFAAIPAGRSGSRRSPESWSPRQLVGHLADAERLFLARAQWFARGFDTPLPSFDQQVAVAHAGSDTVPWNLLIDDVLAARASTVSFFRLLPADAWDRGGVASGERMTVRALAFLAAGHVTHHLRLVRERYSHEVEPPR